MRRSESIEKLTEALSKAQGEFTTVTKAKTAKVKMKSGGEYSYKYADLADILNMALPVLSKNSLCLSQPLERVETQLRVVTYLMHSSGQWLASDGISINEGNGVDPQEFGSDHSYWRRYDVSSLLGIAPDDDLDGAITSRREANRSVEPQAQPQPRKPESKTIEGNVLECASGVESDAEGDRKWMWFTLHNFPNRLWLLDEQLFVHVKEGARLKVTAEVAQRPNHSLYWKTTFLSLATATTEAAASPEGVTRAAPAANEADEADLLNKLFPGKEGAKIRRVVVDALSDVPAKARGQVLSAFADRVRKEKVTAMTDILTCLDIAKEDQAAGVA